MNGSRDAHLPSPADFAGADDINTNLAKEREPEIEIIERPPQSLIITSFNYLDCFGLSLTDTLNMFVWDLQIIVLVRD